MSLTAPSSQRATLVTMILVVVSAMFTSSSFVTAQQVGRWDVVDSSNVFPSEVAAADSLHFALIETASSEEGQLVGRVRRSTDGGRTWSVALRDSSDPRFGFFGIAHPNPSTIVVSSRRDTTVTIDSVRRTSPFEWRVQTSTDAGMTWSTMRTRRTLNDLRILPSGIGYRIFSGPVDTIETTTDAGVTWSYWSSGDIGAQYFYLFPIDATTLYLRTRDTISHKPYLRATTDGGATWSRRGATLEGIASITFHDALNGFSGGGYTDSSNSQWIFRTNDGGRIWSKIFDRVDNNSSVTEVSFADPMNGIATTSRATILRTTDGGQSWTPEHLPYGVGPYEGVVALAYPQKDVAVALNVIRKIFRYGGEQVLARPSLTEPSTYLDQLSTEVPFAWTPIEGAIGYHLQVGVTSRSNTNYDPTIYQTLHFEDSLLSGTGLTVRLDYGRRYYARVRSYSATQTSDWSSDLIMLTLRNPSELPRPEWLGPRGFVVPPTAEFEWRAVERAESYDFAVSLSRDLSNPIVSDTGLTTTSRTVTGLSPLTNYYAGVRSRSGSTTSEWSILGILTDEAASVGKDVGTESSLALEVAPSVLRDDQQVRLSMTLRRAAIVSVEVFSIDGAAVTPVLKRELGAGRQQITFRLPDALPGAYLIRVQAGSETATTKVVVVP